jgi:hypothetical protein
MHPEVEALLKLLAGMKTATPTIEDLAEASGMDDDSLGDLLTQADLDGLIQTWQSSDTLALILSPLGAELLGVRLEEVEGRVGETLFRWVPLNAPLPEVPKASNRRARLASVLAGDDYYNFLDTLPDPKALEPVELVGRVEQLESNLPPTAKELAKREAILYHPKFHLLGLRQRWDGPGQEPEGPCIGCLSRPLLRTEYCTRCDRSGIDFLLPPLPRKLIKALREQPADLAGGSGEAKPPNKPRKAPGVPVVAKKRGRPKGSKSKSKQGRATA